MSQLASNLLKLYVQRRINMGYCKTLLELLAVLNDARELQVYRLMFSYAFEEDCHGTASLV